MRRCLSAQQMKEIETRIIQEQGFPALILMEHAALAVYREVVRHITNDTIVWCVCGCGNNGADGLAVARLLHQDAYKVKIVVVGDPVKATEEFHIQKNMVEQLEIPIFTMNEFYPESSECIIDGIFGIGLVREVTGEYKEVIDRINAVNCQEVIAIDLPSGLCATTGQVLGCAVKATRTVTFEYEKLGLYLGRGKSCTGEVITAKIGFPRGNMVQWIGEFGQDTEVMILEQTDCENIPRRDPLANKGTYGKLLIVAGSVGMCGAAYLSALAAYRTGAGLVKIYTARENCSVLQMQLPEAIVEGYDGDVSEEAIAEVYQWATTMVIGPGLGRGTLPKRLVEVALKRTTVPMVMDSDALNAIAEDLSLTNRCRDNIIITPHMKEMSRLTGDSIEEIKKSPIQYAREYSKQNKVTCLLKDATSVITDGLEQTYLNINGTSVLAKGGTGDVLTGIVAGLLCVGMIPVHAAAYGAYLHAEAGIKANEEHWDHGVIASDLIK